MHVCNYTILALIIPAHIIQLLKSKLFALRQPVSRQLLSLAHSDHYHLRAPTRTAMPYRQPLMPIPSHMAMRSPWRLLPNAWYLRAQNLANNTTRISIHKRQWTNQSCGKILIPLRRIAHSVSPQNLLALTSST